jgi:hypothetical protein
MLNAARVLFIRASTWLCIWIKWVFVISTSPPYFITLLSHFASSLTPFLSFLLSVYPALAVHSFELGWLPSLVRDSSGGASWASGSPPAPPPAPPHAEPHSPDALPPPRPLPHHPTHPLHSTSSCQSGGALRKNAAQLLVPRVTNITFRCSLALLLKNNQINKLANPRVVTQRLLGYHRGHVLGGPQPCSLPITGQSDL